MAQGEPGASVVVTKKKLIIELKHVFGGIKGMRPILMHGEMRHGLVGEEGRRSIQFIETRNTERPIKLLKEQQDARVRRLFFFFAFMDEAIIPCELAIRQIQGSDIALPDTL